MRRILFLFTTLFLMIPTAFAKDNVTEVLSKVRDRYDGNNYVSEVTLRIYTSVNNFQDKQMNMLQKDYADKEMTSLFFRAPADVRDVNFLIANYQEKQTLLTKDDDQWMYLPAFRKIRRISGQDKRGSFMGSTYSYSDLDKLRVHEFTSQIVDQQKIGGANTWVIERNPVSQDIINKNGYHKTILWVDKEKFLVLKQEFYDGKNIKFKELAVKDIKKINGIWTITHSKMTNFNNKKVSEMIFNSIKYNININDKYFSQNILKTGIKDNELQKMVGEK